MKLKKLTLKNFRNYKDITLDFHDDLNVFIGNNGEGKTNILESIYVSSLLKSHRTNKISSLINFGEREFHIYFEFVLDNMKKMRGFSIVNDLSKKRLNINGLDIKRLYDFIGCIKVIMFSPEDMKLIKESPSIRRKFLDISISQIDRFYLDSIIKYNKTLYLRNSLLKKGIVDEVLLDVYDEKLSGYNADIILKRYDYINKLNTSCREVHKNLSKSSEELYIDYKTFIDREYIDKYDKNRIIHEILDILRKNRNLDKIKGNTSKGIHKDDFKIFINRKEALEYASQGQQRSSIISIKLGIVRIIKEITSEYPILLLDDILSELDKERRNFILNFIPDIQTFITSTELYENIYKSCKIFTIKDGSII